MKGKKMYGVKCADGDIIAVTNTKETAMRIMRVVVEHDCLNESTNVLYDLGDTVYLANRQNVQIVSLNYFSSKKNFVSTMSYETFDY